MIGTVKKQKIIGVNQEFDARRNRYAIVRIERGSGCAKI